jgi:hypothetical protein
MSPQSPAETRVIWYLARLEGRAVDRIDQFSMYELAVAVGPLSGLHEPTISDLFIPLNRAQRRLHELLLRSDAPIRIGFAMTAARELAKEVDELYAAHFQDQDGKFSYPENATTQKVHSWQTSDLRAAVQNFEAVLRAEMGQSATYAVPRRGIYDVALLVDRAEESLPGDLVPFMGPKAVPEFKAAGRCMAFGLPTAVGFHMCRAVEGVMEQYYRFFSKKNKELRSWHDYVEALEKIFKDKTAAKKPEERTIRQILHLKEASRNPIMHPRSVLSETDAEVIFSEGKSVMILMAQELQRCGAGPGAPLEELPEAEAEDAAEVEVGEDVPAGPAQ